MTAENNELFLPATHEQYLPLKTPSHAAFSENYTAVADGSTLYVYDKAQSQYFSYEHKTGADATATTLSELQFAPDGTLYFTDQSMWLYSLDLQSRTATRQDISCSTFYIAGDTIYYTATVTGTVTFYYVPLATPADPYSTPIRQYSPAANPRLAYENGTLYCVYNHDNLIKFDTKEKTILSESGRLGGDRQIAGLQYVAAYNGSLYYTVSGERQGENGLFRANDGAKGTLVLEAENLTTLTVHDGRLYCVQGKSVKEIAVTQEGAKFTGYEIAAASSSPNRLAGAVDSVRAGSLLVTADKGNGRVSVYDLLAGGFTSYPVANVSLVATDGATIAATDGDTVTVIAGGETTRYPVGETLGRIKGIACLFSEVYFVTENNAYGVAGKGHVFYSGYGVPTGMAGDLYGKIYVSYHDGSVYAYKEEHFEKRGTPEKRAYTLPEQHTALRADFEGNLYCLAGNAIYKNGAPFALFPEGDPLVYQGITVPVSFALGFEDDTVYFNYGDYMLATKKDAEGNAPLAVPTLGKIALEGAKEQIFSTGNARELLVDVSENAVGINVNLQEIGQAERYFPYAGYSRTAAMRGVKIAQTAQYELVLLDGDDGYKALLLRRESISAVDPDEYYKAEEGAFYLTNAVNACYYPCMEQSLAQTRLIRGASVQKKAVVTLPERQYALVSYQSEQGETLVYVPLRYLTNVNPNGAAPDRYTLGYLKAGETVFRSADGTELTVTERTAVRLYKQDDGAYTVRFEDENGVTFTAENVGANAIERHSSDALRTSMIIILAVLAALIIGVYIYLLPLRKRKIK